MAVDQPKPTLGAALANLARAIKAEMRVIIADPKVWVWNRCLSISEYIKRQWLFSLSPRGLKILAKWMTRKALEAVVLLMLVYAALHLNFLGPVGDVILSFSSASQKDIKELTKLMSSYQDYLNQRNVQANRVLAREHELFADVVGRVFPLKWDSDLVVLSQEQLHELNNARTVRLQAHFRSFKGIPSFYAILKNLAFNVQPDRMSEVKVQCTCTASMCEILLRLDKAPRTGQQVFLTNRPQVHWIASGEFPSDADGSGDVSAKEVACSR